MDLCAQACSTETQATCRLPYLPRVVVIHQEAFNKLGFSNSRVSEQNYLRMACLEQLRASSVCADLQISLADSCGCILGCALFECIGSRGTPTSSSWLLRVATFISARHVLQYMLYSRKNQLLSQILLLFFMGQAQLKRAMRLANIAIFFILHHISTSRNGDQVTMCPMRCPRHV